MRTFLRKQPNLRRSARPATLTARSVPPRLSQSASPERARRPPPPRWPRGSGCGRWRFRLGSGAARRRNPSPAPVRRALARRCPGADADPPTHDPAQVQAATYAVGPGHMQVGFIISHEAARFVRTATRAWISGPSAGFRPPRDAAAGRSELGRESAGQGSDARGARQRTLLIALHTPHSDGGQFHLKRIPGLPEICAFGVRAGHARNGCGMETTRPGRTCRSPHALPHGRASRAARFTHGTCRCARLLTG